MIAKVAEIEKQGLAAAHTSKHRSENSKKGKNLPLIYTDNADRGKGSSDQ
jgi:hypothetical protein